MVTAANTYEDSGSFFKYVAFKEQFNDLSNFFKILANPILFNSMNDFNSLNLTNKSINLFSVVILIFERKSMLKSLSSNNTSDAFSCGLGSASSSDSCIPDVSISWLYSAANGLEVDSSCNRTPSALLLLRIGEDIVPLLKEGPNPFSLLFKEWIFDNNLRMEFAEDKSSDEERA